MLAGTLAAAGWAAGAKAHRRASAARALARYAQGRGLVYVPPPERPRGASPRVVGSHHDVPFVIELVRLRGVVRTRLSADARDPGAPPLSVVQRSAFASSSSAIVTGDDAFDRAYQVTKGTGADAEAVRDVAAPLLALDARCSDVWLGCDGKKIAVSWRGATLDPAALDAARDAVVCAARWQRSVVPYR